ncbi:DUF402 domain-containing protein [Paenibacillus vulneris]|uniref:DUF402 domain-containing protein n=1 Tax=Paenibacillus vulneris TaxID=1133364 RepID=A0ABW3UMR2_9BACL
MKQKIANRPHWSRIVQKRYYQRNVNDDVFEGYVSFLCLDKVREPLFVQYAEERICIAADGYTWLMLFPANRHHSITVMLDTQDQVLQWYFDIIKHMELNDEGVPVIHDLYLDLVLLPRGSYHILDEEELQAALDNGTIGTEDYEMAVQELESVRQSIENGNNPYVLHVQKYVELLRECRSI